MLGLSLGDELGFSLGDEVLDFSLGDEVLCFSLGDEVGFSLGDEVLGFFLGDEIGEVLVISWMGEASFGSLGGEISLGGEVCFGLGGEVSFCTFSSTLGEVLLVSLALEDGAVAPSSGGKALSSSCSLMGAIFPTLAAVESGPVHLLNVILVSPTPSANRAVQLAWLEQHWLAGYLESPGCFSQHMLLSAVSFPAAWPLMESLPSPPSVSWLQLQASCLQALTQGAQIQYWR